MRVDGISVVVACYNGAPWIQSALSSVLQQTIDRPIEIIVIDDGSSDATASIIQRIQDARIRFFQNETNLGTARSRNLGLQRASHAWVAFNDQDDIWLEDKLARQCAILEDHPEIEGVAGGYARLARDGRSRWSARVLYKQWSPSHSPRLDQPPHYKPAQHGTCYIQSLLVQKSTLLSVGGFREDLPIAYDPDVFLRLGETATLGAIEEPVFLYRLTSTSITGAALDARQFLGGFAFMYAAEAARAQGQPEPGLQAFLHNHQPRPSEIQRFMKDQVLRNINTKWVNEGFLPAVLTAVMEMLKHPSLMLAVFSRLRWWSRA